MNVFSTCWNSSRHKDGGAICDEIRELGFECIEASHGLPLSKLPGIIRAVEEKRIRVAGVHNFCPAPMDVEGDVPDAYRFTSHRPEERDRAMRLTRETLQVAARLEARYVVLHMGSVELFRGFKGTKELERMARHGLLGTKEYARAKGELVRRRRRLAPIYEERALAALHTLAEEARKLNLVLAVEGRSHLEQVPGEEDFPALLEEFRDDPHVRYWHDFGHIQRKHNLLLLDHGQYLSRMQPFLYGAHINDVQWPARDHRAPGGGDCMDLFGLICRHMRPEMPMSWELSRSVSREAILAAKQIWDARMQEMQAETAPQH